MTSKGVCRATVPESRRNFGPLGNPPETGLEEIQADCPRTGLPARVTGRRAGEPDWKNYFRVRRDTTRIRESSSS